MADASLQERLRGHAAAFDGLMSLIPAKMYYGEDTSDQWKRKKQTKEQAKAARKGKLDPDSELNRNAKEVMDERARLKRKRQELEEVGVDEPSRSDDEGEEEEEEATDDDILPRQDMEKPGEGLRKRTEEEEQSRKKQKIAANDVVSEKPSKNQQAKEEKKLAKKMKKAEKEKRKAEKRKAGKTSSSAAEAETNADAPSGDQDRAEAVAEQAHQSTETVLEESDGEGDALAPIHIPGLGANDGGVNSPQNSTSGSAPGSPLFDSLPATTNASVDSASTATSVSSVAGTAEKPKHITVPKDTTALRARLAAKIDALRAARNADGPDGNPIRTRQQLIEERRQKQAQRKAHKKELRLKAKEEEDRKREEALASARNSPGSVLGPRMELNDDSAPTNFAFGRVAFQDGTQMSHDLSYEKGVDKKKGPSDPKTALLKLEAQKKRIAGLDENKRKEVLEKETWLAARRRAEGERVRDDEALLKKAVKRKEKGKKKSEREWKERARGVENSIKDRQRKREDNLRKRKEEKGGKGKKKKGGLGGKKNRPGFEGGFKIGGKKK